jgi:hypothetical protein
MVRIGNAPKYTDKSRACPQLADSQGIHGVIHGRST